LAALGDEKVGRLDVAMDDPLGMGRVEGVGNLDGCIQHLFALHRFSGNQVLEGLALEQFHGDEGLAVVLVDLVNRADIRMVERGGGARFALKPLQCLGITGQFWGQEFQRDAASQLAVFSPEDHPHAATAEFFENAVMGDGLAGERRGIHD
jgi:hypothetical protein